MPYTIHMYYQVAIILHVTQQDSFSHLVAHSPALPGGLQIDLDQSLALLCPWFEADWQVSPATIKQSTTGTSIELDWIEEYQWVNPFSLWEAVSGQGCIQKWPHFQLVPLSSPRPCTKVMGEKQDGSLLILYPAFWLAQIDLPSIQVQLYGDGSFTDHSDHKWANNTRL